jgi:ribosomal protein S18 acetylase RimI-like enzyme
VIRTVIPGEPSKCTGYTFVRSIGDKGTGQALYSVGEDKMRQNGAIDAVLWVLRDNLRARRFYEARGFPLDPARPERNHNGDPSMVEVRYRKKL